MAVTTVELKRVSPVRCAHKSLDIMKIKCSPDGRHVASSGFDGHINIWNFPQLEVLYSFYESFCSRVRICFKLSIINREEKRASL